VSAVVASQPEALSRLGGVRRALRREKVLRKQIFRPPPKLTIPQWADEHRILSPLSSAEAGRWRTSRAPYQRGIMEAISDPTVQRVCWKAPSQTAGKSEVLLNTIGSFIDQDPSPMLMVRPSIEDARDFSEDRIKPLIELSPTLRKRVQKASGRRDAGNKMLRKVFHGGHLTLVGANSATGLASRPIRIVLFDEIDKYPPSAGDKGDPIALATNRTKNFWNRKIVLVSTPGVKGVSRIEKEWEVSDQRRFYVPCPHCGHKQHLRWAQIDFETASYVCEMGEDKAGCGALIEERWKSWMLDRGEWIAENPNGSFPGFHLNSLYSPWSTWADLITKFREVEHDADRLRVFVNEDLAEVWDPKDGVALNEKALSAKRETYAAEVPAGVGVLVGFCDVQHDWLEVAVKGYGAAQESWLILHTRIRKHHTSEDAWTLLEAYRTRTFQHESGATMRLSAFGVDSGDGQTVSYVYAYVRPGSATSQRRGPRKDTRSAGSRSSIRSADRIRRACACCRSAPIRRRISFSLASGSRSLSAGTPTRQATRTSVSRCLTARMTNTSRSSGARSRRPSSRRACRIASTRSSPPARAMRRST
jgi:phage terminase large subunit GpA-like protein